MGVRSKEMIQDEAKQLHKNLKGTVCFAKEKQNKPNTRTTELIINTGNNARLDKDNFYPFAEVEGDGLDVLKKVYDFHHHVDHGKIQRLGNVWLDQMYPE